MNSRKRAPGAAVPPLGFSGGVRGTRVKLVNGLFRTKEKTDLRADSNDKIGEKKLKSFMQRGRPKAGEELVRNLRGA
jgi:hypothetical protein